MDEINSFLIVVDMQNDFVDGALGTPEAVSIVGKTAARIRCFDGDILYTMDTHHEDYLNTQEGMRLPVEHCLYGTLGWEINGDIAAALKDRGAYNEDHRVLKGTFGSKDLPERIMKMAKEGMPFAFTLVGLCTDICVISNALLLKAYFPEAPVFIDANCCAGVTPERHTNALEAMRCCQIEILGA